MKSLKTIQAKFVGLVQGTLSFLTDDGVLLPWYSGRQPDYLVSGNHYTVATDGRYAYPACIV